MLTLILGRSGTGKTAAVLERLCRAGAERPQVLIVPEQRSHETERALCRAGGNGVSRYAEVLSFSRLASRVFQAAGGLGEAELDEGGRLLLMYRAVQSVCAQLRVYGRPSRRPAFLRSLLDTVDELKSCCVPPEALIRAGEETQGPMGDKLRDLGLICAAYQALTAQTALDPRDRLTRTAEKLRDCPWAAGRDLWLDGFTDFTPQQELVLRRLMRQAEHMSVTLTCDRLEDDEDGAGVFSPARRTGARLLRMAKEEGVPSQIEYRRGSPAGRAAPLAFLEENLFSRERGEPVSCGGRVELFRAASARSEVEWAAGQILRLVRREGLRFRDIAVAARDYGAYRALVESVFARYGVPVFSSGMTGILDKPVLALVTAALETVAGGYAYDDVFRYLKTGLTGLPEDDRDVLENYVLKWRLRGSRWTGQKEWSWHPRGYGVPWEEEDYALVKRVDAARRQVAAPLETLRKNSEKTGRGQAMALYAFLEEIGLPRRLEERAAELEGRGQRALAGEYRQLWEILCGALEQCAALLEETPMELEEFSALLNLVLSQYDVGTIPVSLDRVTAGETTRQTGRRVQVLFLLGADDSTIPRAGTAPGLLTDEDRSMLAAYGLELNGTGRALLCRELTTVYEICTRPSRKLAVSWSAWGPEGEERRPCFLARRLELLFSDLRVCREEELAGAFRLEAPLPALEQAGRDPGVRRALEAIPEFQPRLERLDRAAGWERGRLSPPAVEALYGKKVPMSASRMDKYKSCHFSYFMRYGLEARPRKSAGFSAPEYGTFVHYVLEHVLQSPEWVKMEGRRSGEPEGRGAALSREERDCLHELTRAAVEQYTAEELGGLEGQSERFCYLFRRLLSSVQSVVDNVSEELLGGQFRPVFFELGFGRNKQLPPVELTAEGVTISVSGFVDRVDGWEHDGRLYLRVVDYKTGRKSFDLTQVWNGLGLQMLLYLFALEARGEALCGKPVRGAGALYLPARDAIVKGKRNMTGEELQKAVDKELRRSGLVLDDPAVVSAMEPPGAEGYRFLPLRVSKSTGAITGEALASAERLGRLGQHLQTVLEEICGELAGGNIAADPFWRGEEQNACRYCDYAEACHFEEGRGGDCRRWLPKVDAGTFWENVEKEKKTDHD